MALILVVEDVQRVRDHILEILRFEGFEGKGAKDGESGLRLARELLPDLIICDIGLPDFDGFRFLELLRHDPASSTIPLIFLTARGDRNAVRRGMSMGANDYIVKPFEGNELVAAVNARLERRATERRRALGDMHDHLGALLTDIDLNVRLMLRKKSQSDGDWKDLERLAGSVREATASFRDGLSGAGDLALVEENLLDGLHLITTRRYSTFHRRIRFTAVENPRGIVQASVGPGLKRIVFMIVQELTTNDLKYGEGDARLEIVGDGASLQIQFYSVSRAERSRPNDVEVKPGSIASRVESLGGSIQMKSDDRAFVVQIKIPLEEV